jgi:hypothetical protein
MRSRFSGRYEFDEHKWRCDGIATRLYKLISALSTREDAMAFKPNYGRDRAERARAARARSEEKKQKRDEKTALRKAQRAEAEPPTDETNPQLVEKQS